MIASGCCARVITPMVRGSCSASHSNETPLSQSAHSTSDRARANAARRVQTKTRLMSLDESNCNTNTKIMSIIMMILAHRHLHELRCQTFIQVSLHKSPCHVEFFSSPGRLIERARHTRHRHAVFVDARFNIPRPPFQRYLPTPNT